MTFCDYVLFAYYPNYITVLERGHVPSKRMSWNELIAVVVSAICGRNILCMIIRC